MADQDTPSQLKLDSEVVAENAETTDTDQPEPTKPERYILAVPDSSLDLPDGSVVEVPPDFLQTVEDASYIARGPAESDPSQRQLIPYCVAIRAGESPADAAVLTYRRPDGGESRLSQMRSVGFGGHIDPEDAEVDDDGKLDVVQTVLSAVSRELAEELGISVGTDSLELIGVINDKSNDVGKVHLGLLYCFELPAGEKLSPEKKETADVQLTPLPRLLEAMKADKDSWETWSQHGVPVLVDHLKDKA